MEEKKEESKNEEEQTSTQDDSTEETNDSQLEEDTSKTETDEEQDEWTPPTKEEVEKLQKKASDFDGMVEKNRIKKLRKEQEEDIKEDKKSDVNDDDLDSKIEQKVQEKVQEQMRERNKEVFDENLSQAYRDFVKVNPWADDDETIIAISKKFNAGAALSKEQLLAKLENAAQDAFPSDYRKAQEDKIRAKLLAEESNIDAGDSGSGGFSAKTKTTKKVKATKEDQRIADKMFNGNVEKYLKYKRDN